MASCFTPTAVLAPPRPRDADHSHQLPKRPNVPRRARRANNTPATTSRRVSRATPKEPLSLDNFLGDVTPPPRRRTPIPTTEGILNVEDASEVVSLAFSADEQSIVDRPSIRAPRYSNTPKDEYSQPAIEVQPAHQRAYNLPSSSNDSSTISLFPKISDEERRARRRATRNLIYAYNLQLKDLARKKDLDACLATMDEMRSKGAHPDAYSYSTVLSCCAKLKATEIAFHLYGRMLVERVRLDEHVLVTVMNIAGRADPPNLDLLRALFHQASSPSRVMCNVFIEGLANAGLVDDVEGVIRYMGLRNLEMDGYTSAGLAKAYVRSGEPDTALSRLMELKEAGVTVPPYAFNTVMSAYSSLGDAESTRKVFDILGRRGRTQVSYNVLIAAYSGSNPPDMQKAFDVFDFMLREGRCTGDRYTLHSLMKVSIAAGDGMMALHTYSALKSNKWMPNQVSYRLAATAAAMERDAFAVAEIAGDAAMNGAQLRRDASVMLVSAALRSGEMQSALTYSLDFLERKMERRKASDYFNDVRSTLEMFDGPVVLGEGAVGIEADEVVADLVAAWRVVSGRN